MNRYELIRFNEERKGQGRGRWRVSCIKEITWEAKNSGERERVMGVMKAEVEIVKLLKYL